MDKAPPTGAMQDASTLAGDRDARLQLIAENARDIVVQMDRDAKILYVSPAVRIMGYRPEEIIGLRGPEFVHPDDLQRLLDNTAHVLRGGESDASQDQRYRFRRKDGAYRWFEGNPSRLVDESGAVIGFLNILRDVHDSVLAADALAEREALYRLLADNMTDIVVTVGVDGRIQYASPSVRTLGYTPEELVGHDRSEFIHADEVPRLLDNMAHLRSGVLDRRRDRSHRIRLKAGGYRWYDGVPSPITDENGVVVAVVNVLRDIDEIRAAEDVQAASEARYRLLADNMGDMIACYGRDGVLTFVAGATQAMLGYEPAELLGRQIGAMVHPDDVPLAEALFEQNFQKGQGAAPFRFEYRLYRKDGSLVWLEAHPRAHFGADGQFVEWQDVIRDITAHKVLEEELRAARRVADAATKTKAAFLADMSHELRGPLSSIASFARLARDRPAVPLSVRTALERIEGASVDLIGMVNDILDFSKLEAAEVVFRMRPTPVAQLVRAAVGLLEPQANAKDLALRLVDRTPPGLVVSLDQGRVRQVVVNLLGNAIKFTHAGRVTLEVRHDREKGRLSVSVRDTGPGIPADRLGHLFDRFTRFSDDDAEPYGGAGLGLAISKAIVEGLGGRISVKTRLGDGSCFSFWIPAAPTTEAFDDEDSSPKLRVLVAHADEDISRQVATALAPMRVEVSTAPDGEAAFKLAARGGVDIILADLELARRGGATLRKLRSQRKRHARVPVVALSPTANDALYAKVLEEGFQGMLATPFTRSDLTSAITHAIALDTGLV